MLKIARVLLLGLLLLFWFLFGLLLCLVRPRHPNNVYVFARMYHAVCPLFGVRITVNVADEAKSVGPAVYVCNHQSNFDIFTVTGAVMPGVVAVGKKSLLWMPFFGVIFWLSGNVLIDRSNRSRAIGTIGQVVNRIKTRGSSIWMFPEGTRSQGRGLLPFKVGAFHTAM
ncbi:MAG: 1-acylglycerol-3-phosphate O-acyltransferase, partial [Aeromonas sp.]